MKTDSSRRRVHRLVQTFLWTAACLASGALSAQQVAVSSSDTVTLTVFGNNSGTTHDFQCPPGHTIGVMDVEHGWHHLGHNGHYINGVRFGCSELLEDGGMANGLVMQSQLGHPNIFGNANGTLSYLDCFPNQWTGIHGRSGQWLDQLGGYCGDIGDVLAGQHDPGLTMTAVGGTGGSPNARECPAGYVPTGAKVSVLTNGHYVQGIELVCGKVDQTAGGPLVGALGILDLNANGGINPATGAAWQFGDPYRLAFVTSYGTSATSTDIATYNTFVQNLAIDAGHVGVDWRALGSTATVDARDNTSTNPTVDGNGIAIFALDGVTRIADNYSDLWDGSVDAHITIDENGNTKLGQVFGGSDNDGTSRGNGRVLGGSTESPPRVTIGNTTKPLHRWLVQYNAAASSSNSLYAISDVLTVTSMADNTPPVLYFTPLDDTISVQQGAAVSYPTVQCYDEFDPQPVLTAGATVSTSQPGVFTRRYTCRDAWGNSQTKDFTVAVYGSSEGSRAESIYTTMTGDRLSIDNVQTIANYSDQFESGALTCVGLVQQIASDHGLSPDDHYLECETDASRRSGELMAAICPEGLYENCLLTKEYGQFVSVSGDSLSVTIDRGVLWWRFWTGVGATVTANDAVCLDPDWYGAETNCFVNGEPNESAIHSVITQDLATVAAEGLAGSGFGLYFVPKLFEYYTWYYTHNERCRDLNDLCRVDRPDPDESRPGYTPVLFPANFSLSNALANGNRVDAVAMENEGCWQSFDSGDAWPTGNTSCQAGRQRSSTFGGSYISGVRFADEPTDWEWGFYTDNQHKHMMTIYDGSTSGFSSDFGINRCYLDINNTAFDDYVSLGQGVPATIAANYDPDFYCTFTQEEYESLMETKLSLDEQEKEAMAQAFFDSFFGVATTIGTGGTGAVAKSAAASARLGKIMKAVGNTIEGIDTALELATVAAEIYVFATEDVQACRSETDPNQKSACFFQATGPALIGLAGDRFLSATAGGQLLDTLTKKVPQPADDLSLDVPADIASGLDSIDFEVQIANTRTRAQVETGRVENHHPIWVDRGVGVDDLIDTLRTNGQNAQANALNLALYEIPETARSIGAFVDELDVRVANATSNLAQVGSLITYVQNWKQFLDLLESGPQPIPRSVLDSDVDLHTYLNQHAGNADVTAATAGITRYKQSFKPDVDFGTCSL